MPEFKDPTYFVHSGGRDQATRIRRGRAAGHRFVQKLAGGSIMVRHKRPAVITAAQLAAHLTQLQEGWKAGRLEVRAVGGGLVDLMSGAVSTQDVVSEPAPNFPLDSAANDKTFEAGVGQQIPQFDGGLGESQESDVPVLLADQEQLAAESDLAPVEESGDPAVARKKHKKGSKE